MFKELLRSLKNCRMGNAYSKAVKMMMIPDLGRGVSDTGRCISANLSLVANAGAVLGCRHPVC